MDPGCRSGRQRRDGERRDWISGGGCLGHVDRRLVPLRSIRASIRSSKPGVSAWWKRWRSAARCLLEPVEKLSIYTPSSGTPKINSAVSSHGGQILGFEPREGWSGWDRVEVYLPHAERQNFIIELRSLTQGLATFEAEFDHMVEVTGRRADDVAKRVQSSVSA